MYSDVKRRSAPLMRYNLLQPVDCAARAPSDVVTSTFSGLAITENKMAVDGVYTRLLYVFSSSGQVYL